MLHHVLYKDEQRVVSIGLLGRIRIRSITEKRERVLVASDSLAIRRCLKLAEKLGVPIERGVPGLDHFFRDLADLALEGNLVEWQVFIQLLPNAAAQQIALHICDDPHIRQMCRIRLGA